MALHEDHHLQGTPSDRETMNEAIPTVLAMLRTNETPGMVIETATGIKITPRIVIGMTTTMNRVRHGRAVIETEMGTVSVTGTDIIETDIMMVTEIEIERGAGETDSELPAVHAAFPDMIPPPIDLRHN